MSRFASDFKNLKPCIPIKSYSLADCTFVVVQYADWRNLLSSPKLPEALLDFLCLPDPQCKLRPDWMCILTDHNERMLVNMDHPFFNTSLRSCIRDVNFLSFSPMRHVPRSSHLILKTIFLLPSVLRFPFGFKISFLVVFGLFTGDCNVLWFHQSWSYFE